MPKIDILELERELRQGKVRPLYVITGEEAYLAREALVSVQKTVQKGAADDSSVKTFFGREAKVEDVYAALKNVSMFGARPLVIIRDGETLNKSTLEAMAEYVSRPVESSTLVIVAEKIDGRSKFMQAAAKTGAMIECKPLYIDKVPGWINMETRKSDRAISHDAAVFLAQMIGNDLGQLKQAIERIILYIGDRKNIELKDVEEVVSETSQHTIFELTDALGTKNLSKAVGLLDNVISNGESPILVLNMFARHLRILAKAKDIAGRVQDSAEAAKYLGVHPYFIKNYLTQAKNFSGQELRRGFAILHRCDRELKSSKISKQRVLEKAIIEIVRN